jgi:hypothetical protein
MVPAKIPDRLLEQACPSIRYRLRLEVLHQDRSDEEMLALQSQILEDPAVKEVFGWQAPDGWLAWSFHGYPGLESGVRLLCEKGVDSRHPVLSNALQALRSCDDDQLTRGLGKPGKILDRCGLGGAQMIRAAVLAYAGIEDEPGVKEQIERALAGFRSVLEISRVDDLVDEYRGKPVFRAGIHWPSLYHLRLLAWTYGWRSPQNQSDLGRCFQRLVKLSPVPYLLLRYHSQLVAPAAFCMDTFNPDMAALDDAGWMRWFQRMELLARLGVIQRVPALARQAAILAELLESGSGFFTKPLQHPYFKKWGAYTGLMLEKDWRDPQRRINDLTFRSILILQDAESQRHSQNDVNTGGSHGRKCI